MVYKNKTSSKPANGKTKSPNETKPVPPPPSEKKDSSMFMRFSSFLLRWLHRTLASISRYLHISREDALFMHHEIDADAHLRSVAYWLFIITAVGIATLGLIVNSPAVIIGAMLVSPLMSPILALGMSVAVSDFYLGLKSALILVISIVASILVSALITLLTPVSEMTSEITARTMPTLLDMGIALFSGVVAALSSVRSNGNKILGDAGPGAAIGVALMPPLCAVGYGVGSGFNTEIMWGAFLLFITNMAAIVLVSSIFYYFVYVDFNISKLFQRLSARREKEDPMYRHLSEYPLWNNMIAITESWKRFLLPLTLVLIVSYPLLTSLLFLRKVTLVKSFIQKQVLAIDGAHFIKGVDTLTFTREGVSGTIFLSSKNPLPVDAGDSINHQILEQFGSYRATLSLIRVAGDDDISRLKSETGIYDDAVLDPNADKSHQNSIRVKHAVGYSRIIRDQFINDFPASVGYVMGIKTVYSSSQVEDVVIEYAGRKLTEGEKNIFLEVIQKTNPQLKLQNTQLDLKRRGDSKGTVPCPKESDRGTWLDHYVSPLDENQNIKLTLTFPEVELVHFEKSIRDTASAGDRINIKSIPPEKACSVSYEYSAVALEKKLPEPTKKPANK